MRNPMLLPKKLTSRSSYSSASPHRMLLKSISFSCIWSRNCGFLSQNLDYFIVYGTLRPNTKMLHSGAYCPSQFSFVKNLETSVDSPALQIASYSKESPTGLDSIGSGNSFKTKVSSISMLLSADKCKEAIFEIGELLRTHDVSKAEYEEIRFLLCRLLINPIKAHDITKSENFGLLAREDFFQRYTRLKIWNMLVHDAVTLATKQTLFYYFEDFGLVFRKTIYAITQSHPYNAGEQIIADILTQIPDQHKSKAYNTLLTCLDYTRVPEIYDKFSLVVFEAMKIDNVLPTSDAFATIIDRLIARSYSKTVAMDKQLTKAVEAYKSMKSNGLSLSQPTCISLGTALCHAISKAHFFGHDLVQIALDTIENKFHFNKHFGSSILLALTRQVYVYPTSHLYQYKMDLEKEWDLKGILALWEAVKNSPLDKESCFYVILHCFSKVSSKSPTIDASLKSFFDIFLMEYPPSSPQPFVHLIAAIGDAGSVTPIDYPIELIKLHQIAPDAEFINAILFYYTRSENYIGALNCFRNLMHVRAVGGKRFLGMFPPIEPNPETLALAFSASCKARDFTQTEEFFKAYFDMVSSEPCSLKEYSSLLRGLRTILKIKTKDSCYNLARAKWAVEKACFLLRQTHLFNYRGPLTYMYSNIIEIYALYAQGLGDKREASVAHQDLIYKFHELVVDHCLKIDATVYAYIFRALGNVLKLGVKMPKVVADFDCIFTYMIDSHIKLNPQVFGALFVFLGAAKQDKRLDITFENLINLVRANDLSDTAYITSAFNLYISVATLERTQISNMIDIMLDLQVYPDEHTFIQLFKNLARQKATILDFRSCLSEIGRFMTPRKLGEVKHGQFEVSEKLLGTISKILTIHCGPAEMTRAINCLLNISEGNNRLKMYSLDFIVSLIGQSLKPFPYNKGEEALFWLERLSKLPRTVRTTVALHNAISLFDYVDKSLAVHFSHPDFKRRFDIIKNSC